MKIKYWVVAGFYTTGFTGGSEIYECCTKKEADSKKEELDKSIGEKYRKVFVEKL